MDEEGSSGLRMGSSCCISLLDVQRAIDFPLGKSRNITYSL